MLSAGIYANTWLPKWADLVNADAWHVSWGNSFIRALPSMMNRAKECCRAVSEMNETSIRETKWDMRSGSEQSELDSHYHALSHRTRPPHWCSHLSVIVWPPVDTSGPRSHFQIMMPFVAHWMWCFLKRRTLRQSLFISRRLKSQSIVQSVSIDALLLWYESEPDLKSRPLIRWLMFFYTNIFIYIYIDSDNYIWIVGQ